MATFTDQFEQQKIPIWYKHYVDYNGLHNVIQDFLSKEQDKEICKLPGIYYYSALLTTPVCLSFDLEKKQEEPSSSLIRH